MTSLENVFSFSIFLRRVTRSFTFESLHANLMNIFDVEEFP